MGACKYGALIGAGVLIGMVLIVVVLSVIAETNPATEQEVMTTIKVEGGYTYFRTPSGNMTPAPSTIQRCIREVLKRKAYVVTRAEDSVIRTIAGNTH